MSGSDDTKIHGPKKYVQVLYDYEYNNDQGEAVSIKENEEFILLQKSSEDWWHVGRVNTDVRLYVPATYVREIYKNVITVGGAKHSRKSYSDYDPSQHKDPPGLTPGVPKPDYDDEPEKDDDSKRNSNGAVSNPVDVFETPVYANLQDIQKSIGRDKNGQEDTQNNTEKEEATYTNINYLDVDKEPTGTAAPPSGHPAVVVATSGDWESHTDETGRAYYYNRTTEETTWRAPPGPIRVRRQAPKPPKSLPKKETSSPPAENGHPGTSHPFTRQLSHDSVPSSPDSSSPHNLTSPPLSPSSPGSSLQHRKSDSLPRGWTQQITELGDICYLNTVNDDRWRSSVDEDGRIYFYKENGHESSWDLPSVMESGEESTNRTTTKVPPVPLSDRSMSVTQIPITPTDKHGPNRAATLPHLFSGLDPSDKASITNKAATMPIFKSDNGDFDQDAPVGVGLNAWKSENLEVFNKSKANRPPPKVVEKSGLMNRTKIQDPHSKKIKKNWGLSFIKLTNAKLLFYKNSQSALPSSSKPYGKPDVTLDLNTVNIEWADKDISSKKNIIQVSGYDGSSLAHYLLQLDDSMKVHEWHNAIQQAADLQRGGSRSPSVGVVRKKMLVKHPASLMPSDEPENAAHPNKLSKARKAQSKYVISDEPIDLNVPERTSRIREKLVNFFRRRPTMENLQQQGILKEEAVFGTHLDVICEREKKYIPCFVTHCIAAIEQKGLDADGMYRISGNLAQVQKLRCFVDQYDDMTIIEGAWDLHVLTGALKLFFRELKEPVIPFKFLDKFLFVANLSDKSSKIKAIRDLLNVLPRQNYETLKLLFEHLCQVVSHSSQNRMQSQNIAIVFGPTLMWPETESTNMAVSMMCQNNLVEFLLTEYDKVFRK